MSNHQADDPFENIQVANPCKNAWQAMEGDQHVRKCSECLFNIYNLTDLSAEEAKELVLQTEHAEVHQILRRHDGTYMATDCPSSPLRSLLGPSLEEIWRQVSQETNARFIPAEIGWASVSGPDPKIGYNYRTWEATLEILQARDEYQSITVNTRMSAPVNNPQNLRFGMALSKYKDRFAALLRHRITLDDSVENDKYIVCGTDKRAAQLLFSNEKVKGLVSNGVYIALKQPSFDEKLRDLAYTADIFVLLKSLFTGAPLENLQGKKATQYSLCFEVFDKTVKDKVLLKSMFAAFTETIEILETLGISSATSSKT